MLPRSSASSELLEEENLPVNAINATREADESSSKITAFHEACIEEKTQGNASGSIIKKQTVHLLPPIVVGTTSSEGSASNKEKPSPQGRSKTKTKSSYHIACTMPRDFWKNPLKAFNSNKPRKTNGKMDRNSVEAYIEKNEDFLEEYIHRNVPKEILERWLVRKVNRDSQSPKSTTKRWKFSVHDGKRKMLQNITDSIKQHLSHEQVLWELGRCISSAVGVDGFRVYEVRSDEQLIIQLLVNLEATNQVQLVMVPTSEAPVVANVVHSGRPLRLNRARDSGKFKGPICSDPNAEHVLYQPIIKPNDETSAVLEMWRLTRSFSEEDEEISSSYLVWGSVALHYAQLYLDINKQRVLTHFLLDVVKSIFQDMISVEAVVKKVMAFAQKLVNADRASLFLVDEKQKELYATVFDLGMECEGRLEHEGEQSQSKFNSVDEVRFPLGTGIAGHVAETGEILNIEDAYADKRFNREIDKITGYKTKNLLCMPIYSKDTVTGVVQMINKRSGSFTKEDEKAFEMFAIYCGLAIDHAKLYSEIKRSEQKYKVALEIMSYHNTCTEEEVEMVQKDVVPTIVVGLDEFYFNSFETTDYEKAKLTIHMFTDLFGLSKFERISIIRFVLTVKKNYRRVPYHNWNHGFSVANSMYNILKRTCLFSRIERIALFISAMCHDLDHRGKNNKYMSDTASPLAAMYSTSTMEHHHFYHYINLLHQDGHNIFAKFSSSDFKTVLELVRHCILATDLAVFFQNKGQLEQLLKNKQVQWDNKEHRKLLLAITMTAADLSASVKPWETQIQTVKAIFQEFYEQGDAERDAGREPVEMMDRRRPEKQASNQVSFLRAICIPCYELLYEVIPETQEMLDMCRSNFERWKSIEDEVLETIKNMDSESKKITLFDLPKDLRDILKDLL